MLLLRDTFADKRRLRNGTFYTISASGSNFNPRNIKYILVVEIFAFLELEQISSDFENYHFSKVSKEVSGEMPWGQKLQLKMSGALVMESGRLSLILTKLTLSEIVRVK